MIRTTLLSFTALFALTCSLFVHAGEKPDVDLTLTEHVDEACKGKLKPSKTAAPKDCIQYRIKITNHGTEAINNLRINTAVPEHTELEQMPENSLWRIEGKTLRLVLNQLPAGEENSVTFNYRVKIL